MKRNLYLFAILSLLAMIAQLSWLPSQDATAKSVPGSSGATKRIDADGRIAAIVELGSPPLVEHQAARGVASQRLRRMDFKLPQAVAYEAQLASEQKSFIGRASVVSPSLRVRTEFRKLANAVSIDVLEDELPHIQALPGVRRVEIVQTVRATLAASVPLIGAPVLWERQGGAEEAGKGIKIAIIDTGIDIANPLFSDAGYVAPSGFPRGNASFSNNKVIVAKGFLRNTSSPDDENGHGTNVASIAAGSFNTITPLGAISGVAPCAWIGNYRVLDKEGTGSVDTVARAIEEAAADGFDIANLSLAGEARPDLSFLDKVAENAVAAGMIVVAAGGNSGNEGPMTIGSPGIAPSVITVAATTNAHLIGPVVRVTEPTPIAAELENIRGVQGVGSVNSLEGTIGPAPYVEVGTIGKDSRACAPLPSGSLAGKVALIERGVCPFVDKINIAEAAGAIAAIVYNKSASEGVDGGDVLIEMSVEGTKIPSLFVTRSMGLALREWAKTHDNARVVLSANGRAPFPADVIPSFSSKGPSILGSLKPDISAPGTFIYAGAIKQNNPDGVSDPSGFLAMTGTSQAAPHVAGAAALIKQMHPLWSPAQIKSALVGTANTDVFLSLDKSVRASLLDMGAGRIDLRRLADVSATSLPSSLSFGINKLKKTVTLNSDFEITNVTTGQKTFSIRVQQLDAGNGVSITPSVTSLSLSAGQTGRVTVTISAVKKADKRDYTGFILVDGGQSDILRVPFWVRFVKKL